MPDKSYILHNTVKGEGQYNRAVCGGYDPRSGDVRDGCGTLVTRNTKWPMLNDAHRRRPMPTDSHRYPPMAIDARQCPSILLPIVTDG